MSSSRRDWALLLISLLAAACMWGRFGVVDRVPEQFTDVVRTPHGIFSDLYPRWLGARELLLHGRDPYGPEVTKEIQKGFYGRTIRPGLAGEPKDEARFAYPVYVTFFLFPTVTLPFEIVKTGFYVALVLAGLFSAWCWTRWFELRLKPLMLASWLILLFGSWPLSDAIHMQQPSLIVCALLSGAVLAFMERKFFVSGILLAISMIKPHLAVPLTIWLCLLSLRKWHERKALLLSFSGLMLLLLASSELVLPGWIPRWIESTAAYTRYTDSESILLEVLGRNLGIVATCAIVGLVLLYCWELRDVEPRSAEFAAGIALIMSCTMALSPVTHAYDQVFLVPGVIVICRSVFAGMLPGDKRMVLSALLLVIGSIWVFGVMLAGSQLFIRNFTRASLQLMLYSLVITPVAALLGLILTVFWRRQVPHL